MVTSSIRDLRGRRRRCDRAELLVAGVKDQQPVVKWVPVPQELFPSAPIRLLYDPDLEVKYNTDPTSLVLFAIERLDIRKDREEAFECFVHVKEAEENTRGTLSYYVQCIGGAAGLGQLYLEAGLLHLEGAASCRALRFICNIIIEAWQRDRDAASRYFDRVRAMNSNLDVPVITDERSGQTRSVHELETPSLDIPHHHSASASAYSGEGSMYSEQKRVVLTKKAGTGEGRVDLHRRCQGLVGAGTALLVVGAIGALSLSSLEAESGVLILFLTGIVRRMLMAPNASLLGSFRLYREMVELMMENVQFNACHCSVVQGDRHLLISIKLRVVHLAISSGDAASPVPAQVEANPQATMSSGSVYRLDSKMANEYLKKIERFQILIMGRANAGKTTILQRVCNSTDKPEIFDGKGNKIERDIVQGTLTVRFYVCGAWKFVLKPSASSVVIMISSMSLCFGATQASYSTTPAVPVIVLVTKSDAMYVEAIQELEDEGSEIEELPEIVVAEKEGELRDKCLGTWMHQEDADCTSFDGVHSNVLNDEGLQRLLISTQQSSIGYVLSMLWTNTDVLKDIEALHGVGL
ncbi:hypothetical protein EDC04DRAFT_2614127 [Pisolithus marmoratus]|nr:hypothetical protein EDC04DRAFT_2614127 [Pisolithus marmoratus]